MSEKADKAAAKEAEANMTIAEKAAVAEGEEKAAKYQAEQEARADDDPLKQAEVAAAEAAEAQAEAAEEDDES